MVDSTKIVAEWRAAIENNQNTAAHGKIDNKDGLYHDKDGNVIDSSSGRGQYRILGLAVSGPALYTFTQVGHLLGSRGLKVRYSVFEVWEGFKDRNVFNVTFMELSFYITPSIPRLHMQRNGKERECSLRVHQRWAFPLARRLQP